MEGRQAAWTGVRRGSLLPRWSDGSALGELAGRMVPRSGATSVKSCRQEGSLAHVPGNKRERAVGRRGESPESPELPGLPESPESPESPEFPESPNPRTTRAFAPWTMAGRLGRAAFIQPRWTGGDPPARPAGPAGPAGCPSHWLHERPPGLPGWNWACCPGLPRSRQDPRVCRGKLRLPRRRRVHAVRVNAPACSSTDSRESEPSRPSRVSRPRGELATSRSPFTADLVRPLSGPCRPLPVTATRRSVQTARVAAGS